ncbi:MAG: VWA domain-containing protein [Phycisphaeraceae bacterium]|nr:VWA domain-containing protein [Phycisphaerales bacterium]MCB9860456.1 VWA domain-containing protein [Phycisphaeraceae bacterium]
MIGWLKQFVSFDQFAQPWALALLALALVPMITTFLRSRSRAAARFSMTDTTLALPVSWKVRLRWIPTLLMSLGVVSIVIALARPQEITGRTRSITEGVAMQLVVDRSGSMNEQMEYNKRVFSRYEVVKHLLNQFILGDDEADGQRGKLKGRPNDMIGLITFARYAQTVCPLVHDHETLAELISQTETVDVKGLDGTATGDAVALAAARLRAAEQELNSRNERRLTKAQEQNASETEAKPEFVIKSKVIVLLTDGATNAGSIELLAAAKQCAEWGIRIYAIGIGSPYAVIQTPFGEQRMRIGSMDEESLRQAANITDGKYWLATDGSSLEDIYEQINALEQSKIETLSTADAEEQFMVFAQTGGVLLVVQSLLSWLVFRRAA